MSQFTLGFSDLPEYKYECADALEFSRTLPAESVKLVITSPPYNIGKSYETRRNIQEYISGFEALISELVRVISDYGSICWQTGNFVDDVQISRLKVTQPNNMAFRARPALLKEIQRKIRDNIMVHEIG